MPNNYGAIICLRCIYSHCFGVICSVDTVFLNLQQTAEATENTENAEPFRYHSNLLCVFSLCHPLNEHDCRLYTAKTEYLDQMKTHLTQMRNLFKY